MTQMPVPSYDYGLLYKLTNDVCTKCGLEMIELNGQGPEPKPPFVAFDIISPHIPLNYLEDDRHRVFETVLSLTVYDLDQLTAMNAADGLRRYLGTQEVETTFYKQEVVLVERMPLQKRSIQNVNTTAAMVGFDFRLRVPEPYIAPDTIDKIEFKEESH